jgi:hypothetical protein
MKAQTIIWIPVNRKAFQLNGFSLFIVIVVSIYLFFYCPQSHAVSWTLNPTLQFQEIYSDNISLESPGNEKSAFVTAINPGVSITGQSARTRVNLNYRMQNLYNAGGNNGLTINNQLQYNSHNTFIPNRFFLDTQSSVSQQNVNTNQVGRTNINGSGNSTNVTTFSLSPYWTPRFGNYASGIARINFTTTSAGNNAPPSTANSNPSLNTLSDTINLTETIQLHGGPEFWRLNWGLSLSNSENYRSNSNIQDPSFQNANAIVRPYINKYFRLFAQGGYSKNNFQATTDNNKSGFYYTLGGQWTPSQRYSISAGAGNNNFITVNISPLQRLSWSVTYRKNAIGTNSGQGGGGQNAGETWQTALHYRTRRSTWSITHDNDTTTVQQILAQNQVFPTPDQTDESGTDGGPNPAILNNPNFTDEVIVTKNWNFSVSFNAGKSILSAQAYDQNYKFQVSGNTQDTKGLSATWSWPFTNKTRVYIKPLWQHTDNNNAINDNQYYEIAVGMRQSITNRLNGSIDFRHGEQTISGNTNNVQPLDVNANGYQENRITASLFMRF